MNLYATVRNDPVDRLDALGAIDLNPGALIDLAAWIAAQIDMPFVSTTRTYDVGCPSGSSKYLLYRRETKIVQRARGEIDLFNVDVFSYRVNKPISDIVVESYGCCGGCGLFSRNTTSWVEGSTTTFSGHSGSTELGPYSAEFSVELRTTIEHKIRACIRPVAPDWTSVDIDPPWDFPF